ncbi:hypothetical protein N7474_008346 [Penicillium riverlandense]|uniref:uncharacterized protein n=1 Tax=Penicillium riverlandense TaxID=1903569 RepID=UPI0025494E79|nr:uncharacterized protein N7474_008346 [Penicillium riverlandense]KAJ5812045.1 hypothetical protein N7474_008346 [Penicillium riverlandense]
MVTPNPSILSILTARPWFYDHNLSFIRFRTDGTGEIWYAGEMFVTVANEFDWKALNPQALKETIHISRGRNVQHLAQLSVEITLTERRPRRDEERARILLKTFQDGKYPFTDSAFRPKTFTVRLEEGKFPLPFTDDHGGPEYRLRAKVR